jgi:hypothetical protein
VGALNPSEVKANQVLASFKGIRSRPDLSKQRTNYLLINPSKTEGILRPFQKVIFLKLTQNWKDFENNGTT